MVKYISIIAIVVSLFLGYSWAQSTEGSRIKIKLTPGKYYQTYTKWLFFKIEIFPQVAVWIEDKEGNYVKTIYVTRKGAKGNWMSAPDEGRPEALPVWNHLQKDEYDAVTTATSKGATIKDTKLPELIEGEYVIKLETNRSYDYNESYTKENSGVTGQPSVIYQAIFNLRTEKTESLLSPVGTGAVDGSDGKIRNGLEGIDTALELFETISISWNPEMQN